MSARRSRARCPAGTPVAGRARVHRACRGRRVAGRARRAGARGRGRGPVVAAAGDRRLRPRARMWGDGRRAGARGRARGPGSRWRRRRALRGPCRGHPARHSRRGPAGTRPRGGAGHRHQSGGAALPCRHPAQAALVDTARHLAPLVLDAGSTALGGAPAALADRVVLVATPAVEPALASVAAECLIRLGHAPLIALNRAASPGLGEREDLDHERTRRVGLAVARRAPSTRLADGSAAGHGRTRGPRRAGAGGRAPGRPV